MGNSDSKEETNENIGFLNGNRIDIVQSMHTSITNIDSLLKIALVLQIIYILVQFIKIFVKQVKRSSDRNRRLENIPLPNLQ